MAVRRGLYSVRRPSASSSRSWMAGRSTEPAGRRVDFETDAALVADVLQVGDHLVDIRTCHGIALLAAALRRDALASLTVIEAPATPVAAAS